MYSPSNRNSPPHHPRLHSFGALTTRYAHRRNRKAEQRSYFWDRTPEIHTENLNMKHFRQDFFLCCVRHPPPTPLLIPTGWQVDNERGASPHPQTQEPHTIIVPVAITFLLFHAFFSGIKYWRRRFCWITRLPFSLPELDHTSTTYSANSIARP